ncbi:MAG: hypothetical protein V4591_03810 [Bdellovibrionota bacterium]
MNKEQYSDVIESLSRERLHSYKQNSEDTDHEILGHYLYNLLENQKLYPPLHILEIIFRNKTHCSIGELLNNKEWLLSYVYEKDPNLNLELKKIGPKSIEEFNKNISRALKASKETAFLQKRNVIEGDLISNLTFGFWTSLYMHIFSNIFSNKGIFIITFKNFNFKKLGTNDYLHQEQIIRKQIDLVRKKRNRIFHYDKINCHKNLEDDIYKLIYYLSIDCHDFFIQRFKDKIND